MIAHISRALLDQILAHAAADPAREVCGLLSGASRSSPFVLSLSKGCPSSSPSQEDRAGLGRAQPERNEAESDRIEEERALIENAIPTANVAADPARRFEVDPAALFAAIRAERAGGARLIGHYHSHPNGQATPSPRDAAMADRPGRLWLIVARGEARCWRESPGGSVLAAFEPCLLSVEDGCA